MSTLPGLAEISKATMLADPSTPRSPWARMARRGKRPSHFQAGPSRQAVLLLLLLLLLLRCKRRGLLLLLLPRPAPLRQQYPEGQQCRQQQNITVEMHPWTRRRLDKGMGFPIWMSLTHPKRKLVRLQQEDDNGIITSRRGRRQGIPRTGRRG